MAENDMTEKTLESYNDVFADIVNVLLFGGRRVVDENDLLPDVTNSYYKADGKLKEQERDVSKIWVSLKIALKQNAEKFSESNESERRHSRLAVSSEFEAAIGKFIKFCEKRIFRDTHTEKQ